MAVGEDVTLAVQADAGTELLVQADGVVGGGALDQGEGVGAVAALGDGRVGHRRVVEGAGQVRGRAAVDLEVDVGRRVVHRLADREVADGDHLARGGLRLRGRGREGAGGEEGGDGGEAHGEGCSGSGDY